MRARVLICEMDCLACISCVCVCWIAQVLCMYVCERTCCTSDGGEVGLDSRATGKAAVMLLLELFSCPGRGSTRCKLQESVVASWTIFSISPCTCERVTGKRCRGKVRTGENGEIQGIAVRQWCVCVSVCVIN
jgi:hypothetical protein